MSALRAFLSRPFPPGGGGFALLEVVAALALVAVSALGIAQALEAAVGYAGAARVARRALAVAEVTVALHTPGQSYPSGWTPVSARLGAGVGVPPLPELEDGPRCWRRVTVDGHGGRTWLWVEGSCGQEPGEGPGPTGDTENRWPGGRLAVGAGLLASP